MPEILKMITGFSDLPLSYFGAEKGKKKFCQLLWVFKSCAD